MRESRSTMNRIKAKCGWGASKICEHIYHLILCKPFHGLTLHAIKSKAIHQNNFWIISLCCCLPSSICFSTSVQADPPSHVPRSSGPLLPLASHSTLQSCGAQHRPRRSAQAAEEGPTSLVQSAKMVCFIARGGFWLMSKFTDEVDLWSYGALEIVQSYFKSKTLSLKSWKLS